MNNTHLIVSTKHTGWWQSLYARLISAHPSITSPAERRQSELISAIALSLLLVVMLGGAGTALNVGISPNLIPVVLTGILALAVYLLNRSSKHRYAPPLFSVGFGILAYFISAGAFYVPVVLLMALSTSFILNSLLEMRWMIAFWLVNTLAVFLVTPFLFPELTGQEAFLVRMGASFIGLLLVLFTWHRNSLERLRLNEIEAAQADLQRANIELQNAQKEVIARLAQIQLAAEVGRAVSQVRALDVMLKEAAELIRAQFDLYYVQVYLVNPKRTHLVLQAGTGEVGAALLARKHQLPLNTGSINGRAVLEKRPEVIADTANSSIFKPNPLLPKTRSEMAVPLLVGSQVVGVLDMQSEQPGGLKQEMLPAFEALAGQFAIAIQNANLLTEAGQARAEAEKYARRLERENWQEYLDAIHVPEQSGFIFEGGQVRPLADEIEPSSDEGQEISAPIAVAGEPLGALMVEMQEPQKTPQTIELVNIVARQVAQQIENLRLLESAERYRFEAEQAARRLTREGWEEYFRAQSRQSLAYLYDLKEVKPLEKAEVLQTEPALTVPVRIREETIGKLAVLDLDTADPETLELIHAVSERLSEHLESLRLLEETQRDQLELDRRAQQLAAVSEISTLSSRETDVNRMLAIVVHLTQRKFGLYHAHIFTYNPANRQLVIVACGWREGDEHEGTHGITTIAIDQEQSLVARAARTRQPVVVNDVRSDPGWLPNPFLPETRAELAVPLLVGDEVLGVLDVQSERVDAFSEEDVNIQVTLAAQVATALQNARNYERARRQAEREALLNAISQKIQSATSVEAVLQIAARELGHALGAPRAIAQLSLKDS